MTVPRYVLERRHPGIFLSGKEACFAFRLAGAAVAILHHPGAMVPPFGKERLSVPIEKRSAAPLRVISVALPEQSAGSYRTAGQKGFALNARTHGKSFLPQKSAENRIGDREKRSISLPRCSLPSGLFDSRRGLPSHQQSQGVDSVTLSTVLFPSFGLFSNSLFLFLCDARLSFIPFFPYRTRWRWKHSPRYLRTLCWSLEQALPARP